MCIYNIIKKTIYIYIYMAMFIYPLKESVEISIGDPRLSIDPLAELKKYDYSKGILHFIPPALKKTMITIPV